MTDKELLAQLNNLKNTRPDQAWLSSNRDILASQLYSGAVAEPALSWTVKFNLLSRMVFQPQYVAIMIVLFFVSSGVVGYHASQPAKPGDSLYIAKRISERAQLMLTFSDASKTKLNVEFATKRVQEMKDIISEQGMSIASDQPAKIADLKASAKAEIQVVKNRLAKSRPAVAAKAPVVASKSINKPIAKTSDNAEFVAAEATKDNQRVDISLPDLPEPASTTIRTAETIINEAEQMLDKDNFDGASKKLDEVGELIK